MLRHENQNEIVCALQTSSITYAYYFSKIRINQKLSLLFEGNVNTISVNPCFYALDHSVRFHQIKIR